MSYVPVVFMGDTGKLHALDGSKESSQHQQNLEYLDKHPSIKNALEAELEPIIDEFLMGFKSDKGYINSGDKSKIACQKAGLPDNPTYHGLAGSLLLEMMKRIRIEDLEKYGIPKHATIIANKDKDQHSFHYFIRTNA